MTASFCTECEKRRLTEILAVCLAAMTPAQRAEFEAGEAKAKAEAREQLRASFAAQGWEMLDHPPFLRPLPSPTTPKRSRWARLVSAPLARVQARIEQIATRQKQRRK